MEYKETKTTFLVIEQKLTVKMLKFGDHIDNWMEYQYCTEA